MASAQWFSSQGVIKCLGKLFGVFIYWQRLKSCGCGLGEAGSCNLIKTQQCCIVNPENLHSLCLEFAWEKTPKLKEQHQERMKNPCVLHSMGPVLLLSGALPFIFSVPEPWNVPDHSLPQFLWWNVIFQWKMCWWCPLFPVQNWLRGPGKCCKNPSQKLWTQTLFFYSFWWATPWISVMDELFQKSQRHLGSNSLGNLVGIGQLITLDSLENPRSHFVL